MAMGKSQQAKQYLRSGHIPGTHAATARLLQSTLLLLLLREEIKGQDG